MLMEILNGDGDNKVIGNAYKYAKVLSQPYALVSAYASYENPYRRSK